MAKTQVKKEEKSAPPSVAGSLQGLREEVDHLFDRFSSGFSWPNFTRGAFDLEPFRHFEGLTRGIAPSVDVTETDKAIRITAELAGMDEKDVEISLSDDGILHIKGEKTEEKEERDGDSYLSERRYGSFSRSFRLPDTLDRNKISADFNKGVLTVTLPKGKKAQKAKKIAIKKK